jgi:hypothetical protein
MRTVFSNHEVPKLWASQSQSSARNANKTYWFEGPRIYSYAECIGHLLESVHGERVALITSGTWSVTTSRHEFRSIVAAHSAGVDLRFRVPSIERPNHDLNLKYLMALVHEEADRAASSRDRRSFLRDSLKPDMTPEHRLGALNVRTHMVNHLLKQARLYAIAFGRPTPDFDNVGLVVRINEMFDRFLDPKAARRERAKVYRERAKAKRAQRTPTITPIQPPRGWIA